MTCRIEPVARLLADGLEDLIYQHWEKVEFSQTGIPLDVDWKTILDAEKVGGFVAFGLRRDGELIGYSGFLVFRSLHAALIQAVNDVIFVSSAKPSPGNPPTLAAPIGLRRLIITAEADLRSKGVARILYGSKVQPILNGERQRDRFADLLNRMGYDSIETMHAKMLGPEYEQRRKPPEGL